MVEQRLRLGQLLVDASIVSQEQLEDVLLQQKEDGRKLGTLLVERGLINETQLTQILSQQLSVPWVSLYHVDFSKRLLSLVPRDVAEKFCLVPIYVRHVRGQGDTLYVAMDDPTNDDALKACSMWAGLPTRAMIASPTDIRGAIRLYYGEGRRASVPPGADDGTAGPQASEQGAPVATSSEKDVAPSAEQPEQSTAPDQTAPQAAAEVAAEVVPEPAMSEEAVEPEPESAAAWKPAAVQIDAWRPDDADFAPSPPPGSPAVESPEAAPETALPAQPAAPDSDQAAPDATAVAAPSATEPATVEPSTATAEDHARSLDAGTLQAGATEPGGAQPSREDDQVTLEVGGEIPLEQVLPEGKSLPRRRAMSGAERLMSLTMLDGTTLALPVRKMKKRGEEPAEPPVQDAERARKASSAPQMSAAAATRTAREVMTALRAVADGVQGAELNLGDPKWHAVLGSLIALLVRKGLIDEQELADELRKL